MFIEFDLCFKMYVLLFEILNFFDKFFYFDNIFLGLEFVIDGVKLLLHVVNDLVELL